MKGGQGVKGVQRLREGREGEECACRTLAIGCASISSYLIHSTCSGQHWAIRHQPIVWVYQSHGESSATAIGSGHVPPKNSSLRKNATSG